MSKEHLEEFCAPSSNHVEFRDRVRKTLYYGQYSDKSLPSLAVTDVAVEVIGSVATAKRKRLDTNYAMAVSRRAKISPCTLMMGILYSERLRQKNPEYLRRVSSSDLFFISVMVASKYLYDEGEDEEVFNDDWARAGSKSVNDVNKLEMEFLASIDWSLFISNEDFLDFVNRVESRVATTHGLYRGWFTYGDLSTLLDNSGFLHTLSTARIELLKVLCACAMAYLLSISLALSVTMLASRHYHHVRQRFTPEHATPCLTSNSACRFHRPGFIKVVSSLWQRSHDTLMARKGGWEMQNNSWISRQSRTSLKGYVHDKRAFHFEDNNPRLVLENTKTVSEPSFHNQAMSNRSKLAKSGNVVELREVMACKFTRSVSSCPPCLPSQISSRNLVLQQSLLSTPSVNSLVTSLARNNFVFSNFSQGSRNNNHRLSYICVA